MAPSPSSRWREPPASAYVPGLVINRAADLYHGEIKTDRRDIYMLAETGRTKRKKIHWLDASPDELLASLRVLNGYDVDLAGMISRLRDALTAIAPAWNEWSWVVSGRPWWAPYR